MGFQTSFVILNDALGYIEEDREFGRRIVSAVNSIASRGISKYQPAVDLYARNGRGGSCSAGTAIETHHADGQVLVAFGGNMGKSLGYVGNYRATEEDMLRAAADKLGFRLVKKPQKKS